MISNSWSPLEVDLGERDGGDGGIYIEDVKLTYKPNPPLYFHWILVSFALLFFFVVGFFYYSICRYFLVPLSN